MAKCKSCGADIIWLKTKAGKLMPCDAKPVPYWKENGGLSKIVTGGGEVVSCSFEQMTMTPPTGNGYIPHWGTCPEADSHRRKRT